LFNSQQTSADLPVPRPSHSVAQLNQLRRQAVSLRQDGAKLAAIRVATGLSVPTIIAANKAYLAGGWDAVDNAPRGRPASGGEQIPAALGLALVEAISAGQPPAGLADGSASLGLWTLELAGKWLSHRLGPGSTVAAEKAAGRILRRHGLLPPPVEAWKRTDPALAAGCAAAGLAALRKRAGAEGGMLLWAGERTLTPLGDPPRRCQLFAQTARGSSIWLVTQKWPTEDDWLRFFEGLCVQARRKVFLLCSNRSILAHPRLQDWLAANSLRLELLPLTSVPIDSAAAAATATGRCAVPRPPSERQPMTLTHLQRLEAESIHIMREVVAETENPVMLYSIGKDSAVMLHLAVKAFYPAKPPFPLLHVDTRWKFRDMYTFRDRMAQELGMDLLVHINPEGVEKDINPFTHGSALHTDIMKTEGLKQALDKYGFDAAFGGARRDEEKSRAKERIFSFRSAQHRWDPKNQRPELWKLYNTRKLKGESIRVFPLSNWTELDVWQYIHLENIPIVPLYYSAERPVVERDGTLIMVDDERMPLRPGEVPMMKKVRFRTLGCYPLTGAVESEADTLPAIIQEMLLTKTSERQGRVIDHDSAASMEKKKQEGYF
jgi:sulfate adenylyltransferase subunit 2